MLKFFSNILFLLIFRKPMIDLAVQLTAANHLSPTNHTLALYHPENGRPIEYKASQMIGSFHVDTVYVVNKKAAKGKAKLQAKPSNTTPPFEVRLFYENSDSWPFTTQNHVLIIDWSLKCLLIKTKSLFYKYRLQMFAGCNDVSVLPFVLSSL